MLDLLFFPSWYEVTYKNLYTFGHIMASYLTVFTYIDEFI